MMNDFLSFEQPINELNAKIKELRVVGNDTNLNISEEIARLETKVQQLTKEIFAKLTPWQITQLARHPLRPHSSNYIEALFTDFDELHGDRMYGQGTAIITGIARFEGQPVVVMGHEKGRKTNDKIYRNFGMPNPEDYRKTHRIMTLAAKFQLPIITFVDTPGAYPGITAEKHNQSHAIASNLFTLSQLNVPIICVFIGEGGSGGALALGVGDRLLMLEYATYSVISPEGCASILWKTTEKASQAASALGLTAPSILQLGLIDEIISEPAGGAHRDYTTVMNNVSRAISKNLAQLQIMPRESLVELRYQKFTRPISR